MVGKIDEEIRQLVKDMLETMYAADGVGLAAPQVGVSKRLCVIDVGDGPVVLINPRIILSLGKEIGREGCLSIPGKWGEVKRAQKVMVEATDIAGKKISFSAEGLFARAIQHEFDHLKGILFTDKAISFFDPHKEEPEGG